MDQRNRILIAMLILLGLALAVIAANLEPETQECVSIYSGC